MYKDTFLTYTTNEVFHTKKFTIIGCIVVSALGTLFHFMYEWLPIPIFPQNESIFEHMKLVVFPYFIYFFFSLPLYKEDGRALFSSFFSAILISMLGIIVGYYTYSGFIGQSYDIVNIILYYIAIAVGFLFIYKKKTLVSFSNSVIFSIILVVLVLLFSIYPPKLSFFM